MKLLKLLIFIGIFTSLRAQAQLPTIATDSALLRYNKYLAMRKLDNLLRAGGLEFFGTYTFGKAGQQISLKKVYVLRLESAQPNQEPMTLLAGWNGLLRRSAGNGLLEKQLLTELSMLTGVSPGYLAIQVGDDRNGDYSPLIYYDGRFRVSSPSVKVKGSGGSVTFGPDDLTNSMFGGYIKNIPETYDIRKRVKEAVTAYLGQGKKLRTGQPQNYGPNTFTFLAAGNGRVTQGYNEAVTLQLNFEPSAAAGALDIIFSFTVYYTADVLDLSRIPSYQNAIELVPARVGAFGGGLTKLLTQIK